MRDSSDETAERDSGSTSMRMGLCILASSAMIIIVESLWCANLVEIFFWDIGIIKDFRDLLLRSRRREKLNLLITIKLEKRIELKTNELI